MCFSGFGSGVPESGEGVFVKGLSGAGCYDLRGKGEIGYGVARFEEREEGETSVEGGGEVDVELFCVCFPLCQS